METWRGVAARADLGAAGAALAGHATGQAVLRAIFGNSPFLGRCILKDPGFMLRLAELGPGPCLETVIAGLGDSGDRRARNGSAIMRQLRLASSRSARLVGIADIAGLWPLEKVTAALIR